MTRAWQFWENVGALDESSCWEWLGRTCADGYGRLGHQLAHRYGYELFVGPIAEGLELDHLCRNRACCNPDHLDPVTHAENVRRGVSGAVNRSRMLARDECARGHTWSPENTKQTSRQRKCRTCIREDSARARARRKATA